jgi:hypothetical protein
LYYYLSILFPTIGSRDATLRCTTNDNLKGYTVSTIRTSDGTTIKTSAIIALGTGGGGVDPDDWMEDLPITYLVTIEGGAQYEVDKSTHRELSENFR